MTFTKSQVPKYILNEVRKVWNEIKIKYLYRLGAQHTCSRLVFGVQNELSNQNSKVWRESS